MRITVPHFMVLAAGAVAARAIHSQAAVRSADAQVLPLALRQPDSGPRRRARLSGFFSGIIVSEEECA